MSKEKQYTREEVKANRIIWANFLMEPERKSVEGMLESPINPGARCCLGHACHIFIPHKRVVDEAGGISYGRAYSPTEWPPEQIEDMLGLWRNNAVTNTNYCGHSIKFPESFPDGAFNSLSEANDAGVSPQEIGKYIMDNLEGGDETPFKPLSSYTSGE